VYGLPYFDEFIIAKNFRKRSMGETLLTQGNILKYNLLILISVW
jgi:hypothetical protein